MPTVFPEVTSVFLRLGKDMRLLVLLTIVDKQLGLHPEPQKLKVASQVPGPSVYWPSQIFQEELPVVC